MTDNWVTSPSPMKYLIICQIIIIDWPAWCWPRAGCRRRRCTCCRLGRGRWRRGRGSSRGWLLRQGAVIETRILFEQIRKFKNYGKMLCTNILTAPTFATHSCALRRWWGRRCRTRASRQGRRPCGAAAPACARGNRHTRSSTGPGLGKIVNYY